MNKSFMTPFKVGLVVIAGIVAAVFMIGRATQDFSDGEATYEVSAVFNDATGLAPKTQVRVAGIAVGEVSRIELVGDRALVTMRISGKVTLHQGVYSGAGLGPDGRPRDAREENVWRDGATVSKKLSSLLGDYYLEVTPGIQGAPILDGGEIYNVVQGGGTEAIISELETITKDISKITNALSDVLASDRGRQRLDSIVQNVEDVTRSVRELIDENAATVDAIVGNVEEATRTASETLDRASIQIEATLRDARQIAAEGRQMAASGRQIVDSTGARIDRSFDRLDAGIDRAVDALDSVNRSAQNVEEITAYVNEGRGTAGRILRDETLANETEGLVRDVRATVQHVDDVISDFDDVFGTIGRLQIHVDLRNDFMLEFSSFKNVLAFHLRPRPHKWYQFEIVRDPRGTTSTVRRTIDSTSEEPRYEEVTETTGDFKFSVQFAGRYEWIAGRVGIIENTGGLGANLYFFDDDLQLITDVFDFNFSDWPRLRAFGMLYGDAFLPWSWTQYLYVSGGIDDAVNAGTRDYFVGIGLSFTDADLKGLLPFAPTPAP